jgi:hypothetical protein
MAAVDEVIKQWLKRAERSGELKNNPLYGKPLDFDDGYLETPEEIRMTYKILKNAGYVPAEVQALKDLAALKEALESCADQDEARELRARIARAQQKVAMMLERLRRKR